MPVHRTLLAAAVVAALALTGCGDDDDAAEDVGTTVIEDPGMQVPTCAEWEAAPPTPEEAANGCIDENGDLFLDAAAAVEPCDAWIERAVTAEDVEEGCRSGPVDLDPVATYDCTDGRVLYWNSVVWGYVGEPAHAQPADAEPSAPEAERTACQS